MAPARPGDKEAQTLMFPRRYETRSNLNDSECRRERSVISRHPRSAVGVIGRNPLTDGARQRGRGGWCKSQIATGYESADRRAPWVRHHGCPSIGSHETRNRRSGTARPLARPVGQVTCYAGAFPVHPSQPLQGRTGAGRADEADRGRWVNGTLISRQTPTPLTRFCITIKAWLSQVWVQATQTAGNKSKVTTVAPDIEIEGIILPDYSMGRAPWFTRLPLTP